MSIMYRSSADHILQILDCRRLTLEARFGLLSKDAVISVFADSVDWVRQNIEQDFVFHWIEHGKYRQHKVIMDDFQPDNNQSHISVCCDAYVKSSAIHNITTLRQYEKNIDAMQAIYNYEHHCPSFGWSSSQDYCAYFDSLFPTQRLDNEKILENVMQIFLEKDRKMLSFHVMPDLRIRFSATPYTAHPELYYGVLKISFGAFCLNDAIDQMAEVLKVFACQLSEAYRNMNVLVCLQPYLREFASPYMQYFRKYRYCDADFDDMEYEPSEWLHDRYMCGVEWLNILSPDTQKHMLSVPKTEQEDIEVRVLASGGLLLCSAKPMTAYGWEEAIVLKSAVGGALYPGMGAFPLRAIYPWIGYERCYDHCPRNDWAIVPVERSEISIIGTDIVFSKKRNGANTD